MSILSEEASRRILVIDDNPAIHEDIRKVLASEASDSALDALENELFGTDTEDEAEQSTGSAFEISSAMQGREGYEMLQQAVQEERPYAMAIVDMRMPPGWDGLETIGHLWEVDPDLQVVICTAYSDHSWDKIISDLNPQDRLLIIRKPFDNIEVRQAVYTLTRKWKMQRELLEASEKRYRFLYDDNPAMFLTIDPNGTIVSANRFGAKQLGYTVRELIGQPASVLYQNENWDNSWDHITKCFGEPDSVKEWEACKQRKDGSEFWVRQTARVIEHPIDGISLLSVCEDITKERDLHERLSYEATHDPLTGLLNRRAFDERLKQSLQRIAVDGSEHVVCYIDLDQFKVINDTWGHLAGDELLRRLARTLRERLRRTDTLARLGGDEFGVIVEGCSLEPGVRTIEALHKDIAAISFKWKGQDSVRITAIKVRRAWLRCG